MNKTFVVKEKRSSILILTSTYPRWKHDTTPGFIADFASHVAKHVGDVYVLAPHYKHAASYENSDNLHVKRYRYFFPAVGEDILYNGGGATKIQKTPLYAVKLLCFMVSLFFNTLYCTLRRNITVINAHWIIPQGLVGVFVARLTSRPLAVTVHGSDILDLNGKHMKRIKRFILRRADKVYVNSSVTQNACMELYKRDYLLIPLGINATHFQPKTSQTHLKKLYHLNDFTILFVGRLTETKGVIYLLEALGFLKAANIQYKALIVGTGPLETELQAYINNNDLSDNVTMVGWVKQDDLPKYYAVADIFVGPSLYEAQGLVFLEALAAGLPVIGTSQGGMKDFVVNGKNGLLITPKSSQELYAALSNLHDDRSLLKGMAAQAAPSVRRAYSWDIVTEKYLLSWSEYLS
jgi:glycosyltransferase involved in cell wall biosynthesis